MKTNNLLFSRHTTQIRRDPTEKSVLLVRRLVSPTEKVNLKEKIDIFRSSIQTKIWRRNMDWYINGKHNECEIYQRDLIEKITEKKCNKTNIRINMITKELAEKKCPMKGIDGYEWSEDFDGLIFKNSINCFNLKFICC